MTVEVTSTASCKGGRITPQNLFTFDNKFVLEGEAIAAGQHTVELRKGTGPLYYNGYMTNFTLEDFIKKAGLEVKVNRKYYNRRPTSRSRRPARARRPSIRRSEVRAAEVVNLRN
jgi:hypothetical protein